MIQEPEIRVAALSSLLIIICASLARLAVQTNSVSNLIFLPYPAALLFLGMVMGAFTFTDIQLNAVASMLDQAVDHVPGFFLFLPAFIFKTVFFMNRKILLTVWPTAALAGIVGFFIIALLSGTFLSFLCGAPLNDISLILLFGGIIGTIDPGDQLKALGRLELIRLQTVLQGEALATTVCSLVIYTAIWRNYYPQFVPLPDVPDVYLILINIAVAVIFGKILMHFLSFHSCDAITYICVSVSAAYLMFGAMEIFVSYGVISLVVLAVIICPHYLEYNQERDEMLLQFWDITLMISNFLVCVYTGIAFVRSFHLLDPWSSLVMRILALYIFITVVRLGFFLVTFPVLTRLTSGMKKDCLAIVAWGGLRSTASLGLMMCMFDFDYHIRFLIYGTGAVLLNQLINGSTFRLLIAGLGLFKHSHLSSFQTVMQGLEEEIRNEKRSLYTNYIFLDADWSAVEKATSLISVYARRPGIHTVRDMRVDVYSNLLHKHKKSVLTDAAIKKKILKIQKVSYARQYAQNMLSNEAYQILNTAIENTYHKNGMVIQLDQLSCLWKIDNIEFRLFSFLLKFSPPDEPESTETLDWFSNLVQSAIWGWFVTFTVVAQIIVAFVDYSIPFYDRHEVALFVGIMILLQFLSLLLSEDNEDNRIFWVILDGYVTIIWVAYFVLTCVLDTYPPWFPLLSIVRIFHLYRLPRLLKKTLPLVLSRLKKIITRKVRLSYDVAKSYILGIDEVLKILHGILSESQSSVALLVSLEVQRRVAYKQIELMQRLWPIPVCQLKSEQCAIGLLRRMRERVAHMGNAGFLDEDEIQFLLEELQRRRANLREMIVLTKPVSPHDILRQIPWLKKDENLVLLLSQHAKPLISTEMLIRAGDPPVGLHIVCAGLVMCKFEPNLDNIEKYRALGLLPNVDFLNHLNFTAKQIEYVTTGAVLGEIGLVTGRKQDYSATCLSKNSLIYSIPTELLQTVLSQIELDIWKSIAHRIGTLLMLSSPQSAIWTLDEIRAKLEEALFPNLQEIVSLDTGSLTQVVILIEGVVMAGRDNTFFYGPCIVPSEIQHIFFPKSRKPLFPSAATTPRLLIIPDVPVDYVKIETTHDGNMIMSLVADSAWQPPQPSTSSDSPIRAAQC